MRVAKLLYRVLFGELDHSITRLQEIRDSYRQLNVEIYGEEMASILNDW
jgi:hypothetical protein